MSFLAREANVARPMRPKSIIWFERIVWFNQVFPVAAIALEWEEVKTEAAASGLAMTFVVATSAASIALVLLLVWLIGRRASRVAKWIYVLLMVLGFLMIAAYSLADLAGGNAWTRPRLHVGVQNLLYLLSIWLLFRRDARRWFRDGRRRFDPEIFR